MLLSACTSSPSKIEVLSKPIEQPKLNLSMPPPIKMEPLQWIVITEKNYQETFDRLRQEQGVVLLISLDEANYKNLAINNAKVLRYVREQKAVIAAYRKYYEPQEKR